MRYLLGLLPPLLLAVAAGGGGAWLALPPLVLFGLVPVLDQLLPLHRDNTPAPRWVAAVPIAFVPAHFAALGYALYRAAAGVDAPGAVAALVVAAGLCTAMAINVAHELMHRPGRAEQALATLLLSTALYTHFSVEHVQGHHKRVGTADDPATSRLGESIFAFLPRTLLGSARSAWRIEAARAGLGPGNRVLQGLAVQLGVVLLALALLGGWGLLLGVAQATLAVLMLETINYLEHYGLVRELRPDGGPVRVRPEHSWNSSHPVSNAILLNLARHSDHHAYAARAFRELRHHEDVPQLPGGYAAMLLLAWVPPLWFRVMDPRVAAMRRVLAASPE